MDSDSGRHQERGVQDVPSSLGVGGPTTATTSNSAIHNMAEAHGGRTRTCTRCGAVGALTHTHTHPRPLPQISRVRGRESRSDGEGHDSHSPTQTHAQNQLEWVSVNRQSAVTPTRRRISENGQPRATALPANWGRIHPDSTDRELRRRTSSSTWRSARRTKQKDTLRFSADLAPWEVWESESPSDLAMAHSCTYGFILSQGAILVKNQVGVFCSQSCSHTSSFSELFNT